MSVRHLALLAVLLEANGKVVSREELNLRSGGKQLTRGSRRIDMDIARIRHALGSLGRYVIAVPRRGYRIDTVDLARAR